MSGLWIYQLLGFGLTDNEKLSSSLEVYLKQI